MCRKLPAGLFWAAVLVKLDLANAQMHIWLGGMPDAYLLDLEGKVFKILPSYNLPLAILAVQQFAVTVSCNAISDAVSLFLYSDGFTEQRRVDQSMFGTARLIAALRNAPPDRQRTNHAMASLRTQPHPQGDNTQWSN